MEAGGFAAKQKFTVPSEKVTATLCFSYTGRCENG
jgi:hypothetical protein